MRLAISATVDAIARTTGLGRAATSDVTSNAAACAGTEPM